MNYNVSNLAQLLRDPSNSSLPWVPVCTMLIDQILSGFSNSSTPERGTSFSWENIFIPLICFFGISGNTLNLIVLTKKRMNNPQRRLEKAASVGLTALAFSDLLFSACVFLYPFFTTGDAAVKSNQLYLLYYRLYGISAINLFLMTSAWLIVELALERYIVLYFPLRAKCVLGIRRTKAVIVSIFLASLLATLPYFLKGKVVECQDLDGNTMYQIQQRWQSPTTKNNMLTMYMRWVWPFIAAFIPLTLLFFCNVRLIQGLRRVPTNTKKLRSKGQPISAANNRITLTLIVIVFMSLILVTPSEILRLLNPYDMWGEPGHIAASVANAMQTINFAFNFILYCTLDVHFRRVFKHIILGHCIKKSRNRGYGSDIMVLHINQTSYPGLRLRICLRPSELKPCDFNEGQSQEVCCVPHVIL
ncbi:hypothetical protein CAPTEDRAFT_196564 [Capitella teleta]|uniref:G-protein coupled receptors family 1 profile domain-containing protein n=1 Tax=Capitella teleta TaxID=283909 RepID=R7TPF5_CAPTE|nr:hypothetical protein CAPTEDRAFT_196564 [Capitella teleta]|eukprot:ELT95544.1 hypothetical protein CAPTEDRAFT_196564 [Capitella teleta]